MTTDEKAVLLVEYVSSLSHFKKLESLTYGGYGHMGATITDAILQAGQNWYTVVEPRVRRVREQYPQARTTSSFMLLCETVGVKSMIDWKDAEKPGRILAVTRFFKSEGIETEEDLKRWMAEAKNIARLKQLRGIGPKTLDYFRMLVGISTTAIDRHVLGFLDAAGIATKNYDEAHEVVEKAADRMKMDRQLFDLSIWEYMALTKR